MPYYIISVAAICAGYGWAIERKVTIAVPLILQFLGQCLSSALSTTLATHVLF